jgi:hypothetical protein
VLHCTKATCQSVTWFLWSSYYHRSGPLPGVTHRLCCCDGLLQCLLCVPLHTPVLLLVRCHAAVAAVLPGLLGCCTPGPQGADALAVLLAGHDAAAVKVQELQNSRCRTAGVERQVQGGRCRTDSRPIGTTFASFCCLRLMVGDCKDQESLQQLVSDSASQYIYPVTVARAGKSCQAALNSADSGGHASCTVQDSCSCTTDWAHVTIDSTTAVSQ